jgi:rhodanese-related sulfurtransferase
MNVEKIAIAVVAGVVSLALASSAWADNCPGGACSLARKGAAEASAKPAAKPQTTCPVMGGKINKKVFLDVKGYRVYACCAGCLPKIKANPAKYIAKIEARGEAPVALCKCGAPKGSPACKAACQKARASLQPAGTARIGTPALATLVRASVPLVLLDARGGELKRLLPGAKRLGLKATAEQAAALIPDKDALVVTYCANPQCPASHALAERLAKLGYTNVVEYPKGIDGWTKAGLPVDKVEE